MEMLQAEQKCGSAPVFYMTSYSLKTLRTCNNTVRHIAAVYRHRLWLVDTEPLDQDVINNAICFLKESVMCMYWDFWDTMTSL